jgi:hypothetical protein
MGQQLQSGPVPGRVVMPDLPDDLPSEARRMSFLGVEYHHLKTDDGGDLYLTRYGASFWRLMMPENWFAEDWFKDKRRKLVGTSTVYQVPTRRVSGVKLDLVVKFSRVGEVVPMDTFTVNKFVDAEFNSPFEEFSLLMELREGRHGPRGIRIRTQRPMAIYVPSKRLQLWQTGRSESKINAKIAQHPGVEIDILRQYVVIFNWVKGLDAAQMAEKLDLDGPTGTRFLSNANSMAVHEMAQKGYRVIDMKPEHVILREKGAGRLLRDRNGQPAYALIDYELLQRTPEHEASVRSNTRKFYLSHMAHRFEGRPGRPLPRHLQKMEVFGIDYVFGHTESTGGLLWVVGKDPDLFNYFLPERWRRTPRESLGESGQVNHTCTKDNVHLVWRVSRMGDEARIDGSQEHRRAVEEFGYNSPFGEFALAIECAQAGIKTVYPRAVYMTGSRRGRSSAVKDLRRHRRYASLRTPDGDPLFQRDRDYIAIYGYWSGPSGSWGKDASDGGSALDGRRAVEAGWIEREVLAAVMKQTCRKLEANGLVALAMKEDHLLLSAGPDGEVVCGKDGMPDVRLCNLELVRRMDGFY